MKNGMRGRRKKLRSRNKDLDGNRSPKVTQQVNRNTRDEKRETDDRFSSYSVSSNSCDYSARLAGSAHLEIEIPSVTQLRVVYKRA